MGKQWKIWALLFLVYHKFAGKFEEIFAKKVNFKRFRNFVHRQGFYKKLI